MAAVRKIYGWRGSYFNDALVQRFIRFVEIYPLGTVVRVVYDAGQDWEISPLDINLFQEDPQYGDRIIGYESPHLWRINPLRVLGIGNNI